MLQQNNGQKTKMNRFLRILLTVMIIFAAAGLLGDIASGMISRMGGVSFSIGHRASIGIIGGADGPTAVFVTSSTPRLWHLAGKLLILMIGIFGLRYLNRK